MLLSDTVGFVRDLPHNLVASFKATLEEAIEADLLLHVLDVGHPHAQQQFDSVRSVLKEIGAGDQPEILLLNKIDTEEGAEAMYEWRALHPEALAVSAKTGRGVEKLVEAVYSAFNGSQTEIEIECDLADGRTISFVESNTRVKTRSFDGDKARFVTLAGEAIVAELKRNRGVNVKAAKPPRAARRKRAEVKFDDSK